MKFYFFKGFPHHVERSWWINKGVNNGGQSYFKLCTLWFVVGFTLGKGKKK